MLYLVGKALLKCCVNASYTYRKIYSLFRKSSSDFSFFLPPSRWFHSLPLASVYIIFATSIPKNVPNCSRFYDILPTYYIQFKNVHCSYINLIDSKYSISSLKAFDSSRCHYSQKKEIWIYPLTETIRINKFGVTNT